MAFTKLLQATRSATLQFVADFVNVHDLHFYSRPERQHSLLCKSAVLAIAKTSVRLSVCMSHCGRPIESKRWKQRSRLMKSSKVGYSPFHENRSSKFWFSIFSKPPRCSVKGTCMSMQRTAML